jgi:phenylalanyl-tRNA synthetase beta chain
MKISYNWIKEITGVDANPDLLINKLTNIGLKLEDRENIGNDLSVDLEITVNRPDCLSHAGIAREVAATFNLPNNKKPEIHPKKSIHVSGTEGSYENKLKIILDDPGLCPRYCGQLITNVKIGPSPDWLKQRLEVCGIRSINNAADITNYVMLELGQPLHAFDFDKLAGGTIRARRAKNEKLVMIDGKERQLTESMLIIADAEKPQGVGGVMGGLESEVTDQTKNVLLEAAYFLPSSIRQTRRALDLSTDASYRFERGVDPNLQDIAIRRAAFLLEKIAGATVHPVLDVNVQNVTKKKIYLRPERITRILGESIDPNFVQRILTSLGFIPGPNNAWEVPSFRVDVNREIDLIEEVARHFGYNNFPSTLPSAGKKYQDDYETYQLEGALARVLQAAGIDEGSTYSFTNPLSPFMDNSKRIRILNPISETANELRSSLIPGLLDSVDFNLRHRAREIRLYEIGRTFHKDGEKIRIGIVIMGEYQDLKGILEGAFPALEYPKPVIQDGKVLVNNTELGKISQHEVEGHTVQAAELSLSDWIKIPKIKKTYQPIIAYPDIERDVTFIIDEKVPYSAMQNTIERLQIPDLRSYKLIDRYKGKNTPAGKISLTFRFVFQSENRTLLSEEVDVLYAKIVSDFAKEFGAELRK